MLSCGGGGAARISHHLRDYNNPNKALGSRYSKTLELSSSFIVSLRRPSSLNALRVSLIRCVRPNSSSHPQQSPVLSHHSFSQSEDNQEPPSGIMPCISGGIVALGKFDALHIGHRELAIQAAKMGIPYLLSFVGMAEVLGWEQRAPIVAKCDRKRVLSLWSPFCGGKTPKEFEVEFSKVRSLTPRQFVEKLSKDLGVRGVVAGENYRFGYRAAGNASDLVRLCEEYGMDACIISSVMDKNQDSTNLDSNNSKEQGQVSSTRVCHALAKGNMKYVSELLGRRHRLVLAADDLKRLISSRNRISVPVSSLLNLPPKEGRYDKCSFFIDDKNVTPCRVIIEKMHIHLELDELDIFIHLISQNTRLLGIEFGELELGGV